MPHQFLSPEWIAAARAIRDEYKDRLGPPGVAVRLNQVITGAPGGVEIRAHIDTSEGRTAIELGHLERPDVTVTLDYTTARQIFVDEDQQAAMQAFLGGKIRVEGDVSKLLLLQAQAAQGGIDPLAAEIAQRMKAITERPSPTPAAEP
ncbi:MAG: SCP2 sterol-binding domain-containing protein [Acidimicrobiales bacterium]